MRILAVCVAAVALWPVSLSARQKVQAPPVDACEVIAHPEKYAGQIIGVKGVVREGFEELSLGGMECEALPFDHKIWLDFPYEQFVKEEAIVREKKLKFKRDAVSEKFDQYLREKCMVKRVQTTLRGFLQYQADLGNFTHVMSLHPNRNGDVARTGQNGYGHMGQYHLRLITLSVEQAEKLSCTQP
jgi:hypothetical protein